jgi:hypothetical protein
MPQPITANELLDAMRNCGFTIRVVGNSLEVRQARWIDDELEDLITKHKVDLITILREQ